MQLKPAIQQHEEDDEHDVIWEKNKKV